MPPTIEEWLGGDALPPDNASDCGSHSRCPSNESLFGAPSETGAREDSTESSLWPIPAGPIVPHLPHHDDPEHGLKWGTDGHPCSVMPRWTVQPTIDDIILTLANTISPNKQYEVEHCWDGVFNKIYNVTYDKDRYILRVSLPVFPRFKTESEVATLRWIDSNTRLPVPKVKYYDASRDNAIGFEWILMDRMEGSPLSLIWDDISLGAKERIVKQIAAYAAAAFERQFAGIGNLYPAEPDNPAAPPRLGKMVAPALF
ncbi:hypothetical protein GGR52DRAFT_377602 [Hypoxylon sp. FL1284]|nr:hypothetical protein GGR52DRAFT_377602 [Hypoxylon sp. FL1284]